MAGYVGYIVYVLDIVLMSICVCVLGNARDSKAGAGAAVMTRMLSETRCSFEVLRNALLDFFCSLKFDWQGYNVSQLGTRQWPASCYLCHCTHS